MPKYIFESEVNGHKTGEVREGGLEKNWFNQKGWKVGEQYKTTLSASLSLLH